MEIKKKPKKVDLTAEHLSVPLPATGIDYPFMKKRPFFIKDAPNFEPLWLKQIQKFTVVEPSSSRVVYDCTYEGVGVQPLINMPPKSRYFDRLPDFHQLKSATETTLLFESRFESGNLARAI